MTTPTWFITGASSGFGMAFTRYALARGYNVVATARNPAKLEQLEAPSSSQLLIHKLDVTAADDAERTVASTLKRFGRVDVLINKPVTASSARLRKLPIQNYVRRWKPTSSVPSMSPRRCYLPCARSAPAPS